MARRVERFIAGILQPKIPATSVVDFYPIDYFKLTFLNIYISVYSRSRTNN